MARMLHCPAGRRTLLHSLLRRALYYFISYNGLLVIFFARGWTLDVLGVYQINIMT